MASDKNVGNNMDTEVVVDMDTDLEADPDSVAEAQDLGLAELEEGRGKLLATVAMDTEAAGEEVVDIVAVVGNTAAGDTDTDNMENMVAAVEVDILQMGGLVQPLALLDQGLLATLRMLEDIPLKIRSKVLYTNIQLLDFETSYINLKLEKLQKMLFYVYSFLHITIVQSVFH